MTAIDYGQVSASRGPGAAATGGRVLPVSILLFLITVMFPMNVSVGGIVLSGSRIVLLIMIVPLALRLLSGAYGRILACDWLFGLHTLWMIVAIGVNNPQRVVMFVGSNAVELLGAYLLGRALVRDRRTMAAVIIAAASLVALTIPLAVIEAVTGRSLPIMVVSMIPGVNGAQQIYNGGYRMGLTRVQMGYATPIHYGLVGALLISLCGLGLKDMVGSTRRWLLTLASGLCVFFSLSSGALLPMMLQFYLIGWSNLARRMRLARPWLVLLGLAAFGYVTIDLLSNRSPYRVFMTYATFSSGTAYYRDAINTYGMENVWANPLFGLGLRDWARPSWMVATSVDNYWLLTAMRYGIPGFLTLALGFAYAVWKVGRADLGRSDEGLLGLRRSWVFVFGTLAFALYTVHIWADLASLVYFLLGAGLWMVEARPDEAGRPEAAPAPRHAPFSRFAAPQADLSPAAAAGPAAAAARVSPAVSGRGTSVRAVGTALRRGPASGPSSRPSSGSAQAEPARAPERAPERAQDSAPAEGTRAGGPVYSRFRPDGRD